MDKRYFEADAGSSGSTEEVHQIFGSGLDLLLKIRGAYMRALERGCYPSKGGSWRQVSKRGCGALETPKVDTSHISSSESSGDKPSSEDSSSVSSDSSKNQNNEGLIDLP